ncbi:MAG TPA: helix-turn-helix transcriptional regulator [Candidatus Babeliaceae bacterium]|nr:helix-turn-helix transcriptional regulator [Candidatus Babeliaceae bacterium]
MPKYNDQEIQSKFGENLRRIRMAKGYSLQDLANLCDVDKSNIGKIENGHFNLQLTKIFELAKGLGVSPKDLLDF